MNKCSASLIIRGIQLKTTKLASDCLLPSQGQEQMLKRSQNIFKSTHAEYYTHFDPTSIVIWNLWMKFAQQIIQEYFLRLQRQQVEDSVFRPKQLQLIAFMFNHLTILPFLLVNPICSFWHSFYWLLSQCDYLYKFPLFISLLTHISDPDTSKPKCIFVYALNITHGSFPRQLPLTHSDAAALLCMYISCAAVLGNLYYNYVIISVLYSRSRSQSL